MNGPQRRLRPIFSPKFMGVKADHEHSRTPMNGLLFPPENRKTGTENTLQTGVIGE